MVHQIVVGVGAYERHQVSGRLKSVEVLILTQKRLPLVARVAPTRRPHGVAVTVGQAQADRHEVSRHAAQNSDGPRGRRTESAVSRLLPAMIRGQAPQMSVMAGALVA